MFPEPTELRLIGYSIESIWTPKSKSSTSTPKPNLPTKGNFTRDEWNHLLCLFNSSYFSSRVCSEAMAKRLQQDSGEERVTAKSRPMMSLIARARSNLSSSTSESQGKRSYGNQDPWSAKAEREDRTVQPVVTSWGKAHESQSSFFHERTQHDGTAQSIVNEAKPRDGTGQPVVIPQRGARPQQLIIGNDETESELSEESRSFLSRVNDQVRNEEKHSMIW